MKVEYYLRSAFIVGLLLLCVLPSFAQQAAGALRGQVTDPSGAAISGASVVMTPATGSPIVVQSNGQGMYEFKSLPVGKYTLTIAATGFTIFENDNVVIADQPLHLNVAMTIEVEMKFDGARAPAVHCTFDHRGWTNGGIISKNQRPTSRD